jgi:hypothetical protein
MKTLDLRIEVAVETRKGGRADGDGSSHERAFAPILGSGFAEVGEDALGGVAVQLVAGAVVAAGGARAGVSIKDFPSGVCTMFACAALGHLARNPDLLDPGSVVELFKYEGDQGGHAFIVVNRAGTPDDVDSWGPQCYVIDPWYARHRITPPGTNAVKDMTAGTAFHDPAFVAFLKDANSRAVQVTFPHMQLIQAFS